MTQSTKSHYQLIVAGGGSGGIGAAIAASRRGVDTLVIERNDRLGGTSTLGGVNTWEMGVGGTGIPFDLYLRMKDIQDGVGVYYYRRHFCLQEEFFWPHELDKVSFPGGDQAIDPELTYLDTLRRHPPDEYRDNRVKWHWAKDHWHGVPFEPEALHRAALALLAETGSCTVLFDTTIAAADSTDSRVRSVTLANGTTLTADYFVDCTGDAVLCGMIGCRQVYGVDPRSRFDEPGAPEDSPLEVNPPSLLFRITHVDTPQVEPLPDGVPSEIWWRDTPVPSCVNSYPNGDRNINMLPSMEGAEFLALGYDAAYVECRRRVYCHWHFLQTTFPEFQSYRLERIFPMLGVRESKRTFCEKMLTELDVLRTLTDQNEPDNITICDHALDRHGQGGGCPEVAFPFGVPYRCLIPTGWRNVLVACRGAGFSSIAASSVRLSRMMMQLGQAAGNAVALATEAGGDLPAVEPSLLRSRLQAEHVQLEFPMSPDLRSHIERSEQDS